MPGPHREQKFPIRANRTRCQTPSLLRGLIFGSAGRAMSPTHARGRRGQQYRYYVSQSVLKGSAADGPAIERLDPLWEELFPAKQARIIRLLVDRADIGPGGADVRLELEGLASLARDLAAPAEAPRAAA